MSQKITKSVGVTETERLLSKICDDVFLKLWTYPNVYRQDGKIKKEICDVLIVFEDNVFIFSDKSKKFGIEDTASASDKDIDIAWKRWKKKTIDDSIKQLDGAEKHIRKDAENIFIDEKCEIKLPIPVTNKKLKIHKIIVAHGAEQACKNYSSDNLAGSLAVIYRDKHLETSNEALPFFTLFERDNIYHLFDSYNLKIVLGELDTVYDLVMYFEAKEEAIKKYDILSYCGEEDLLANYYSNFDSKSRKYHIKGKKSMEVAGFFQVVEGEWENFSNSASYQKKKLEDKAEKSRLWDHYLQFISDEAFNNVLLSGNIEIYNQESAVIEMAKEPRFMRREISKWMFQIFNKFPENAPDAIAVNGISSSYHEDKFYVLLQFHPDHQKNMKFINTDQYTEFKGEVLKIACGAAKNKYPNFKKIIGIAMDAPKCTKGRGNSECFFLLDEKYYTEEDKIFYEDSNNKHFNFFASENAKTSIKRINEFPEGKRLKNNIIERAERKIGRNEPCPCGTGKKYKKCCLNLTAIY